MKAKPKNTLSDLLKVLEQFGLRPGQTILGAGERKLHNSHGITKVGAVPVKQKVVQVCIALNEKNGRPAVIRHTKDSKGTVAVSGTDKPADFLLPTSESVKAFCDGENAKGFRYFKNGREIQKPEKAETSSKPAAKPESGKKPAKKVAKPVTRKPAKKASAKEAAPKAKPCKKPVAKKPAKKSSK